MENRFYKGDQNLAWDAVPHAKALLDITDLARFFIQDEKLGTADARITHESKYELTTDYCGKYTGAVWIHQDVSCGPFYALPTEPKDLAKWGFYTKHFDESFERVICKHGIAKELEELGIRVRPGQLLRGITEGECYLGIVPTIDEQKSISSYKLSDPELSKTYLFLFLAAYRGALRVSPRHRWGQVRLRAKKVLDFTAEMLKVNENATISDLQTAIWGFAFNEFFKDQAPKITHATDIFSETGDIPHIVLATLLSNPEKFAESYNEALNKAHLALKRLKMKNGSMELPFFIGCKVNDCLVRWSIRATFGEKLTLKMFYKPEGLRIVDIPNPPSVAAVKLAIEPIFGCHTIIGKAGPLLAELSRPPLTIVLPEQGSKYAPMVGHLTEELIKNGIDYPRGRFLRIRINAIESLLSLGDVQVILPKFLSCFWGGVRTARWISQNWMAESLSSKSMLDNLRLDKGQLLNLAKYAISEFYGELRKDIHPKLKKLGDVKGISKPLSQTGAQALKGLLTKREKLLEVRRKQKEKFKDTQELIDLEKSISLFSIGMLKRHNQLASLFYVNNRPYALSFYLAFGAEIIRVMSGSAQSRSEEC